MLRKLLIGLLLAFVAAYVFAAFIGIEPKDRRPGTLMSGVQQALPSDLSFANEVQEVTLETRPWYGIPFSVTVVAVAHNDVLYVPSLYDSPQAFPGTKYWNTVIVDNPKVRLRIGASIYAFSASPVLDEEEFAQAFAALGQKYPFWREQIELDGRQPRFALIRLDRIDDPA